VLHGTRYASWTLNRKKPFAYSLCKLVGVASWCDFLCFVTFAVRLGGSEEGAWAMESVLTARSSRRCRLEHGLKIP